MQVRGGGFDKADAVLCAVLRRNGQLERLRRALAHRYLEAALDLALATRVNNNQKITSGLFQ